MAWDREKEKKAGKTMAIGTSVFGLLFSIFWCVMAASMGAGFMLIFGIPFAGLMAYRLYVCLQYAKKDDSQKPRQEADLWDRPADPPAAGSGSFCPYCGGSLQEGFAFCPHCGRRLG